MNFPPVQTRNVFFVFILPVLLILFITLTHNAYAEEQQVLEENASLVVGVSLALSGPVAEYGEALRNGIELAREEHSDLLSDIRFLYEDDRYDGRSFFDFPVVLKQIQGDTIRVIE